MEQRYIVSDSYITQNNPLPTAVNNVDTVVTSTISAANAAEVIDNNPAVNSYVSIDAGGKGTFTMQVSGTWTITDPGSLRVQVTVDDQNWITLFNPYSLLCVSNMDFDGEIHSGRAGIWQTVITGYSAVRVIAVGTGWTGTANITLCSSNNVREYFANIAGVPYTKNLSLDGTGTGTVNIIGDYSTTSTDFYYQPPVNTKFYINKLTVQLSDASKFTQADFGGIAALTNGIKLYVENNAIESALLGGHTIFSNKDFFTMTPDAKLTTFDGLADTLVVSFNVEDVYGLPLILVGNHYMKFIVRVHDNFTGLLDQRWVLHGRLI